MWVKNEAPLSPLSPLYHGPYKVLKRCEKFFSILTNTGLTSVSVDRIKAATVLSQADSDVESSSSDGSTCASSLSLQSDLSQTENHDTY